MAAIAVWVFIEAGGAIQWSGIKGLEGADMWLTIFAGGALWVSIYGTFVLNFCDFTRSSVSKKSIVKGNFWGIPINMLVFGAIVVVMAGGQYKINGTVIQSPSDIVQSIPNTLLLVLACLALLILTIAVNLMANFVAPVYALTNLFPRHLNFRKAAWVSGTIGLVILPWNLYNNPIVIVYFLGGLGALLGPLLSLDIHFAAGNFIRDAMAGQKVIVQSAGTAVRSYLYAADLTVWLWAIFLRAAPNSVYNVGSDEGISVGQLAERVATLLGDGGFEVLGKPDAGWNPGRYVPSTAKIRNELGLRTSVGLDEAIRRTAMWNGWRQ